MCPPPSSRPGKGWVLVTVGEMKEKLVNARFRSLDLTLMTVEGHGSSCYCPGRYQPFPATQRVEKAVLYLRENMGLESE